MKKVAIIINLVLVALFISNPATAQEKKKNTEEVKIQTSAVCGMCKDRIEGNMTYEKGVRSVSLDDKTKEVTISYDSRKTDAEKLRTAISKLGYDADKVAADKEAYAKLPKCCQKGNEPH